MTQSRARSHTVRRTIQSLLRTTCAVLATMTLAFLPLRAQRGPTAKAGSVRIETLPWTDVVRLLDTSTVVMIPLGAQSKEHGPHLPLNNDWLLAEYFAKQVAASTKVIVYPTINYSFYPAFLEYPGSTSLRLGTARDR